MVKQLNPRTTHCVVQNHLVYLVVSWKEEEGWWFDIYPMYNTKQGRFGHNE